ncbi:MAG: DNA cytosine methyltransferase [Pseudomonadota bacterium]
MIDCKNKIESIFKEIASEYTPPGSETNAVIHQWIHALQSGSSLFAEEKELDKNLILNILKLNKLLTLSGKLKKQVTDTFKLKPENIQKFRFVDLFAGIGGMRQGFESVGGVCVFSSEYEKNAQSTYEENYGEMPFGDITKISENDIPEHDILIAGFPCQPFSHAGLKLGIDDTRGTLFYDIARILKKKKPKIALLENVRGLVSHEKGYTLKVILKLLTDIGYKCAIKEEVIKSDNTDAIKKQAKHMILRSKEFGVPQNRVRIYIVLWRNDLKTNFEYPIPTNEITRVGDILEENPDVKYTISDKLWAGHQRRKINNKKNGKGFGFGLVTEDSEYTNTISARYYKDGSEVLIAQKNKNPRKITPREAARLQGFPEDFIINKSDVQAYKQFGNSVSVPVIKAIAKKVLRQL